MEIDDKKIDIKVAISESDSKKLSNRGHDGKKSRTERKIRDKKEKGANGKHDTVKSETNGDLPDNFAKDSSNSMERAPKREPLSLEELLAKKKQIEEAECKV